MAGSLSSHSVYKRSAPLTKVEAPSPASPREPCAREPVGSGAAPGSACRSRRPPLPTNPTGGDGADGVPLDSIALLPRATEAKLAALAATEQRPASASSSRAVLRATNSNHQPCCSSYGSISSTAGGASAHTLGASPVPNLLLGALGDRGGSVDYTGSRRHSTDVGGPRELRASRHHSTDSREFGGPREVWLASSCGSASLAGSFAGGGGGRLGRSVDGPFLASQGGRDSLARDAALLQQNPL
ncbi:hypothetical protein T492DRAFT_876431 [Pavlovales sp. CCMP2436]|nr:hypothetical protein T492DRAFT_876431 [Pavlovales sp. CCMP2436]